MAKAEMKTKVNEASVEDFLSTVADEQKRQDSFELVKLFEKTTKEKAKMWGTAIVGFGSYHYKYDSGREGDMCLVGFSPRKANLTLYVMLGGLEENTMLDKLGKHKTSKGCLYINKLDDVDLKVLAQIIKDAYTRGKAK